GLQHTMRDRGEADAEMKRTGGLRHVVDIDRRAADMLVRRIVTLVGGDAAGDFCGLEVGSVLGHHAASCRETWIGAVMPLVSAKNRRSRLREAIARYSAVARMSVSGEKSLAYSAIAATTVSSVHFLPTSA